jgi:hypothetical protein
MLMRRAMLTAVSLLSVVAACGHSARSARVESAPRARVQSVPSARVDHVCYLVGCGSHVAIEVQRKDLQPGDYELRVEHGQLTIECTFTVAPPAGDDDSGTASGPVHAKAQCQQTAGAFVGTLVEDREKLVVYELDTPESLSIRLIRDGIAVRDDRVEPEYAKYYPNGPDCEPTCLRARVPIAAP